MSYPNNLAYFLDSLAGFSTNYFKILPQGSTTASPNAVIRWTLPSNSLINTRNISFNFNATTSGTAAGARLPSDISTLISRVEVSVGGVQLSAGANFYSVLNSAKRALMEDYCDPVLSHPEMVRTQSYVDDSAITTTDNEVYSSAGKPLFSISKWHGFLGSVEPSIIDTGRLPGDMVITLYLEGVEALSSCAGVALEGTGGTDFTDDGTGLASYTLSDMELIVEAVGMGSNAYDSMIDGIIASSGVLELPFKQYFSFQDTNSGSQRFSVNTKCLDRIIVAHRNASFNSQVAPVKVKGYKAAGGFTSATSGGTVNQDIGVPDFDIGGNFDYNKERYHGAIQDFPEPSGDPTYQFQINNAYLPTFKASWEEMYGITKASILGKHQVKHGLDTMKSNYSVQCVRLNLPMSEGTRLMSGLNTAGISMNGYYNIDGASSTPTVTIFCEATSVLQIGANRQVQVQQ